MKGQLHGGSDSFRGIVIIIDTFVNSESQHMHKDIAVLVNDGTKNAQTIIAAQVCSHMFKMRLCHFIF
jgi:hypothetical protein